MNDLQKCQLEMLIKTVNVLDELGLKYCLIGGTLLGAVRHQGFIPWDDDIDIGMPRADFDRFAKIANEHLPEGLFYQDKMSDVNYPYSYAKIRKDNTLFIERPLKDIDMHHGVYIDIFPLDYSSEDLRKQSKHIKKVIYLNYISISPTLAKSENNKSITKKIQVLILRTLKFMGGKSIERMLDKNLRKYFNTAFIGNLLGIKRTKELMPLNIFTDEYGNFGKIAFEGVEFTCPIKVDEYLTQIYGDYMQLPPEDKRTSHHQTDEIKL